MNSDALAGLIAGLPDGTVVTDPAITEGYRQDRAFDPSAGKPLAVVRPRSTEEVQTVLRWATAPDSTVAYASRRPPWRSTRAHAAIPSGWPWPACGKRFTSFAAIGRRS